MNGYLMKNGFSGKGRNEVGEELDLIESYYNHLKGSYPTLFDEEMCYAKTVKAFKARMMGELKRL